MQNALLIACGFMLLGVVLRARLRWLAAIYVPASLVAGLVALILTQTILITNSGDAFSNSAHCSFGQQLNGMRGDRR